MYHRHIPALSGVALAAVAVLGVAAPSQAAFPGRNGKIAVAFFDDPSGGVGPARSGIGLLRADRGPAQKRTEVIACTDDRVPPRDCLRDYGAPAFSPNGRWIAFDAGRRIAVVRTDGTGLHMLPPGGTGGGTRELGYWTSPAWSPNGKRIVFDAPRSTAPRAVSDLYVVAADGSGRAKRVVRNAADPSWSVHGLFAFERPSNAIPPALRRIWVSRSNGAHARPVSSGTNRPGQQRYEPPGLLTRPGLLPGRIAHRLLLDPPESARSRRHERSRHTPARRSDEFRPAADLVAGRPPARVVVQRHLRRPERRDPRAPDRQGSQRPHELVQLLVLRSQLATAATVLDPLTR